MKKSAIVLGLSVVVLSALLVNASLRLNQVGEENRRLKEKLVRTGKSVEGVPAASHVPAVISDPSVTTQIAFLRDEISRLRESVEKLKTQPVPMAADNPSKMSTPKSSPPPRDQPRPPSSKLDQLKQDAKELQEFWTNLGQIYSMQKSFTEEEYQQIVMDETAKLLRLNDQQKLQLTQIAQNHKAFVRPIDEELKVIRRQYREVYKANPKNYQEAVKVIQARQEELTKRRTELGKQVQQQIKGILLESEPRQKNFSMYITQWLQYVAGTSYQYQAEEEQ